MLRIPISERPNWRQTADQYGFQFHTMYGEPYWDETHYYQFSLRQIENDLEDPTEEIHQMCLEVVDDVVNSESLLRRFQIPEGMWGAVADSWRKKEPSLYSRLDLAYDGRSPAKLLENNADTPTSLFETGLWQWLWLEQQVDAAKLSRGCDQFNSLQEKLIHRLAFLRAHHGAHTMHFCSVDDSIEDRGTVQYLQDCAEEAGLKAPFVDIADIGLAEGPLFVDRADQPLDWCFKLYPWEFMFREEYAEQLCVAPTNWLEPMWKSILSNKALLPALWKKFPNHPNLLPAWFDDELASATTTKLVRKPIFSREGANISILDNGQVEESVEGPYGDEGYIYQAYHALPKFGDSYTLIGSWLVDNQPAGISVREDRSRITQDLSRFIPHVILG